MAAFEFKTNQRIDRSRQDVWRACAVWALVLLIHGAHAPSSAAQGISHSDIDFVYHEGAIATNRRVYTASMSTAGISQQYSSDPGFASETDVGAGIGANDQVVYHVLSPLIVWDGQRLVDVPATTSLRIQNNPSSLPDVIVTATSGEQRGTFDPPQQRIGQASASGDFHSHVGFFLEPLDPADPAERPFPGAYGVKLQLASSRAEIDPSEPFFVVFNYGLDTEPLAMGVATFESLVTKPNLLGDFDGNGQLDVVDIDALSLAIRADNHDVRWDVTEDGFVNLEDHRFWVESLRRTYFGDANLDRQFNSTDFVDVFQYGEYEDAIEGNSGWSHGDWNGDGDFDTTDFVVAFQGGGFEQGPRAAVAVPEPASPLWMCGLTIIAGLESWRRSGQGDRQRCARHAG